MARIGNKNTAPEKCVRTLLHRSGYRYRLHGKHLPGTPDIHFPDKKKALFVHGCFWHRHPQCKFSYTPKTRAGFWRKKFEDNVARDRRVENALRKGGWDVLVVWECEAKDQGILKEKLFQFLGPAKSGEVCEKD